MADEEEEHAAGWLLEALEQGVGGVPVHFLRRIDDHDAPAVLAGGQREEGVGRAHIVHHDLGTQAPPIADSPFDNREIAMTAGRDPPEDGMLRGHGQPVIAPPFAAVEHETRKAVRQRRLADAARPRDQPGMGEPAALPCVCERGGGGTVPDEMRVHPRRRPGEGGDSALTHRTRQGARQRPPGSRGRRSRGPPPRPPPRSAPHRRRRGR